MLQECVERDKPAAGTDDISADKSANDSEQVASKSIKVFKLLRDNLGQEQLLLSMTKLAFQQWVPQRPTTFVCSSSAYSR